MPGRRGFDTAKEIAKEYPHKWSSATLYRDFMRVIRRKYPPQKHIIYRQILNDTFHEHEYISDDIRMSLMGTGPTSLGSLAVEEEFYDKGLKHPQHPHRYDMIDILCSAMDSKKIHPLPYLVQRDIWYYFGLGEQQQDILSTKVHKICKNMNEKYSEISAEEKDYHRQWLLKRLNLFEDSTREKNKSQQSLALDSYFHLQHTYTFLFAHFSSKNRFEK